MINSNDIKNVRKKNFHAKLIFSTPLIYFMITSIYVHKMMPNRIVGKFHYEKLAFLLWKFTFITISVKKNTFLFAAWNIFFAPVIQLVVTQNEKLNWKIHNWFVMCWKFAASLELNWESCFLGKIGKMQLIQYATWKIQVKLCTYAAVLTVRFKQRTE